MPILPQQSLDGLVRAVGLNNDNDYSTNAKGVRMDAPQVFKRKRVKRAKIGALSQVGTGAAHGSQYVLGQGAIDPAGTQFTTLDQGGVADELAESRSAEGGWDCWIAFQSALEDCENADDVQALIAEFADLLSKELSGEMYLGGTPPVSDGDEPAGMTMMQRLGALSQQTGRKPMQDFALTPNGAAPAVDDDDVLTQGAPATFDAGDGALGGLFQSIGAVISGKRQPQVAQAAQNPPPPQQPNHDPNTSPQQPQGPPPGAPGGPDPAQVPGTPGGPSPQQPTVVPTVDRDAVAGLAQPYDLPAAIQQAVTAALAPYQEALTALAQVTNANAAGLAQMAQQRVNAPVAGSRQPDMEAAAFGRLQQQRPGSVWDGLLFPPVSSGR